jgi:hypothetical protein
MGNSSVFYRTDRKVVISDYSNMERIEPIFKD